MLVERSESTRSVNMNLQGHAETVYQDQKTSSSALQAIHNLANLARTSIIVYKLLKQQFSYIWATHHPTKTKWTPSGTYTVHNSSHKLFNIASFLIEKCIPPKEFWQYIKYIKIKYSFQKHTRLRWLHGGCQVATFQYSQSTSQGIYRLKSLLSFTIVVWLRALMNRAPYKSAKSISPQKQSPPSSNYISRKSP